MHKLNYFYQDEPNKIRDMFSFKPWSGESYTNSKIRELFHVEDYLPPRIEEEPIDEYIKRLDLIQSERVLLRSILSDYLTVINDDEKKNPELLASPLLYDLQHCITQYQKQIDEQKIKENEALLQKEHEKLNKIEEKEEEEDEEKEKIQRSKTFDEGDTN
jgi:hypothetical protein